MTNFIRSHQLGGLTPNEVIIAEWFQFFKDFKSGCTFAAMVARKPEKFGWFAKVIQPEAEQISAALNNAILDPTINTLSLIFPTVTLQNQLEKLVAELYKVDSAWLEFTKEFDNTMCYGFRLKINSYHSWVTGFGNFSFLPKTRQTPYTSITLRIKPKPIYEWVMKPSAPDELHLADINVFITSKTIFEKMWKASFERVKQILGHSPDLKSAAKTTFSLPLKSDVL